MGWAIVIILLIILIFALYYKGSEHFDMNYNHDRGAAEVYAKTLSPQERAAIPDRLRAEYKWSEKDKSGRNVYDKYYEEVVQANAYAPNDAEYAERELHDSTPDAQYDVKFSNLSGNRMAPYSVASMMDITPMSTIINGRTITLAQKPDVCSDFPHAIRCGKKGKNNVKLMEHDQEMFSDYDRP